MMGHPYMWVHYLSRAFRQRNAKNNGTVSQIHHWSFSTCLALFTVASSLSLCLMMSGF